MLSIQIIIMVMVYNQLNIICCFTSFPVYISLLITGPGHAIYIDTHWYSHCSLSHPNVASTQPPWKWNQLPWALLRKVMIDPFIPSINPTANSRLFPDHEITSLSLSHYIIWWLVHQDVYQGLYMEHLWSSLSIYCTGTST